MTNLLDRIEARICLWTPNPILPSTGAARLGEVKICHARRRPDVSDNARIKKIGATDKGGTPLELRSPLPLTCSRNAFRRQLLDSVDVDFMSARPLNLASAS